MSKWEYLFVTCEYVSEDWRPRYVNGKELERGTKWGGMSVYDFCNLIGAEGWELVDWETTHNQHGVVQSYRLVFKRPLA